MTLPSHARLRARAAFRSRGALFLTAVALGAAACGSGGGSPPAESAAPRAAVQPAPLSGPLVTIPGMPPVTDASDLYAADRPGMLSDAVRGVPARVYVPNSESDSVSVIDPATYKVVATFPVGRQPQHVVPSWDLKTLWVNNDRGNTLTPIDPSTGAAGAPVDVHDPYNLYFTPDGKYAVVMASLDKQLVFRDAHTMAVVRSVPADCDGVNHADFSPDGRYFIVSCEFSGDLLKVDTLTQEVVAKQHLPARKSMPQDVKISPDGRTWYVADMMADGVWVLDGDSFSRPVLVRTGKGAHGLYISRDSTSMYVSNRGEGSITVWRFAPGEPNGGSIATTWHLPGGGSPDMGGVSADGRVLWLSGRYNSEVYAIDTGDGHLIARIPVGRAPHGLAVFPQPGRYSLGHTGVYR